VLKEGELDLKALHEKPLQISCTPSKEAAENILSFPTEALEEKLDPADKKYFLMTR
jgi:hypothetical protein